MGRRLEALRNFATSATSRTSERGGQMSGAQCLQGRRPWVSGILLKVRAQAPQRFGKAASVERRGSCAFRHKIAATGERKIGSIDHARPPEGRKPSGSGRRVIARQNAG